MDEAHSSQTGEAAKDLKAALGAASAEAQLAAAEGAGGAADAPLDPQDALAATVAARGRQPNLSFFAFTATPKARTLELFGRKNADGNYAPFHLYSMRQAIEEGFILDVLANYTTYATYWKVGKAVADDPRVRHRKARRSIARFVSLHPHNLAQKAEVIVEHFREHTRHKIGGQGQGDGRDLVAPPRRPLQAGDRRLHRREGVRRHEGRSSRSPGGSTTPASSSPSRA